MIVKMGSSCWGWGGGCRDGTVVLVIPSLLMKLWLRRWDHTGEDGAMVMEVAVDAGSWLCYWRGFIAPPVTLSPLESNLSRFIPH